jgi:hypothetical protein
VELLKEVDRRTSIAVSFRRQTLTLDDPDLFSFPFLYFTGALDFTPFTEEDVATLRRFLSFGGFMLVNDASGYRGSPFDRRMRDEVQRIFPDQAFERLPFDHAVFRSYYLVRTVAGRRLVSLSLEGVTIDDATPQRGQTLTATVADGNGVPASGIAYQWEQTAPNAGPGAASDPIPGATARTFVVGAQQNNRRLRVVATFTDLDGFAETATSALTSPVTANANTTP